MFGEEKYDSAMAQAYKLAFEELQTLAVFEKELQSSNYTPEAYSRYLDFEEGHREGAQSAEGHKEKEKTKVSHLTVFACFVPTHICLFRKSRLPISPDFNAYTSGQLPIAAWTSAYGIAISLGWTSGLRPACPSPKSFCRFTNELSEIVHGCRVFGRNTLWPTNAAVWRIGARRPTRF